MSEVRALLLERMGTIVKCVACGQDAPMRYRTCGSRHYGPHDLRTFDPVTRTFSETSLNLMTPEQIIAACKRLYERGTKPTLPEVRPLVQAYYDLPGNGAGGELHIVLDDHNYERPHIVWCIQRAEKLESAWLGEVLLLLSNSQRRRL